MPANIVTVTAAAQQVTQIETSDIIWGLGLWLTSVSVFLSIVTTAAAIIGVWSFRDYKQWRNKTETTVQNITKDVDVLKERTREDNLPPERLPILPIN